MPNIPHEYDPPWTEPDECRECGRDYWSEEGDGLICPTCQHETEDD